MMAHSTDPTVEEAMTSEELGDQEPLQKRSKTKNAFTELMSRKQKPKPPPTPASSSTVDHDFRGRKGLGEYLINPSSFPPSIVLFHDADFVAIRDKFPKATIHTLLLPRSRAHNLRHPFDALDDPAFLAAVRDQTHKLKRLVAAELQRMLGKGSAADAPRQAVLDGTVDLEPGEDVPPGRDWAAEVMCGVHAVPSMAHLHVHVLSRDMRSDAMRHRKHYNSFTTPFLVDLADFPLPADDPRRDTKTHGYLARPLRCWRCGKDFGSRFQALKDHLEEEFETWKRL